MKPPPRRGFVHYAILDKRRPVIVISPDVRNQRASDVLIVPCSTILADAPTHVRLRKGEGGLRATSIAKCEQITNLHKDYIDGTPLGIALAPERMREIERALLRAIGVPVPL